MPCESGKFPYKDKCYTVAELEKAFKTATEIAKNGGNTSSSTTKTPTTPTPQKQTAFDWGTATGILAILAGAAPAIISATKGQTQPQQSQYLPQSGSSGGNDSNTGNANNTGISMWVWGGIGVIVLATLYFIFRKK